MKDMFEKIFTGGISKDVYDILSLSLLSENSKFEKAFHFVQNIYSNLMVPIALSLLIIYFCVVFIEKTTNEQFTYEQMFLLFAKMVVAIFLIDKGFDLLVKFHEFGLLFLKEFDALAGDLTDKNFSVDNDPTLQAAFKDLTGKSWDEEWKWLDNIKHLFPGGIFIVVSALFSWLVKCIIYVVVFLRILEIYVRTMFAPIALSDVFYNGLNSTGFKFLKSYLAVSIQVVLIYGTTLLYGQVARGLMGLADNKGSVFLLMYLGLSAATIGIILKSQTLVKEFVGTN